MAPLLGASEAMNCSDAVHQPEEGVVVIHGIFDPAGERLLELKPVRRYAYHSGPTPHQQEGRFLVEVVFINGTAVRVPFDALIADDLHVEPIHGFFEVVIPVEGEIAYIRITDFSGEKTFAYVHGSEILP
jgi:hypothetical protein